ncbi:MazG nucleotide pyrophosphohydrolase domain-containing protein [Streptococcus dentiloxodontae]
MDFKDYQNWVKTFYQSRNWYQYNSFIRSNFLTEEVGELAQAVRKYEIGRDRPDEAAATQAENLAAIKEELGDVLDNIIILADKYDLSLEDIVISHKEKIEKRFEEDR